MINLNKAFLDEKFPGLPDLNSVDHLERGCFLTKEEPLQSMAECFQIASFDRVENVPYLHRLLSGTKNVLYQGHNILI